MEWIAVFLSMVRYVVMITVQRLECISQRKDLRKNICLSKR